MKKIINKSFSILFIMALLVNSFSPFAVFALDTIETKQEEQLQDNNKDVPLEKKDSDDYKEIGEQFENANDINTIDSTELNDTITSVPMTDIVGKGNIEVETHLVLPIVNSEKNNITFTIYDSFNKSASIDLNKVNEPKDGYYEDTIKLGNQQNVIRMDIY